MATKSYGALSHCLVRASASASVFVRQLKTSRRRCTPSSPQTNRFVGHFIERKYTNITPNSSRIGSHLKQFLAKRARKRQNPLNPSPQWLTHTERYACQDNCVCIPIFEYAFYALLCGAQTNLLRGTTLQCVCVCLCPDAIGHGPSCLPHSIYSNTHEQ